MSETPETPKNPPENPPEDEQQTAYSMEVINTLDESVQMMFNDMLASNKQLIEQNQALVAQVKSINDERAAEKQQAAVTAKLEELKAIAPALADKYKESKDLTQLETIIDTAKSMQSGFADYTSPDTPKGKFAGGRDHPTRYDPLKGQFV